eukprot:462462_1
MSTKKKILLIFGYIRNIEQHHNLFSIIPLTITSVVHQYYTKISSKYISKDSVIDLYQFAQQLNDDHLIKILWKWLGIKPPKMTDPLIKIIFEHKSSIELAKLLQKDYISINEQRIFSHSIHWLKKQYLYKKALLSIQARNIIEPILKHIRFPLMSIKFLSTDVYETGLLTENEFLGIIRAKCLNDKQLTIFNMNKRKKIYINDMDDGFDDENRNDITDMNEYIEIIDRIRGVLNSGEYNGYPMQFMYSNDTNYWCSCDLMSSSKVWIIFDCQMHKVDKIEIRYQSTYSCSIVKIYASDSKVNDEWDRITKKENMIKGGHVHTIRIKHNYCRFIKLKFEDWSNGYVGIERIRFYQIKT